MEKILTKEEFKNAVENNGDKLVLFDYKAGWCGPCRVLGNVFEEILPVENVVAYEVDLDEADEELATENSIRNIPTVLFYKNGLLIDRFTGMIGKEAVENKIKENLAK